MTLPNVPAVFFLRNYKENTKQKALSARANYYPSSKCLSFEQTFITCVCMNVSRAQGRKTTSRSWHSPFHLTLASFCAFPWLSLTYFLPHTFEAYSLGASFPSLPPARPICGLSILWICPPTEQPAVGISSHLQLHVFFLVVDSERKQAHTALSILWMHHAVILLSENSVMSIIDALEKW